MRRLFFTIALGAGLAILVGPGRAFAFAGERVQAHVPFAFHVDGTLLPAGDYLIRQADMLNPAVVSIQSRTTGEEVLAMTDNVYPDQSIKSPELVFDRYGNQEFLHAIRLPDASGGLLRVSPAEVHAARVANRKTPATAATGMSR